MAILFGLFYTLYKEDDLRDIIRKSKKSISKAVNIKKVGSFFAGKKDRSKKGIGRFLNYDLLVACLYALIIVFVTWPLISNLSTLVPGLGDDTGDTFHFLWNMWWFEKVVENGIDVFYTSYLYFPNGVSLVYHTLTLAQGMLVYLMLPFVGMVTAFNLLYMLFMFLSAYLTYYLAYYLWGNRKGAFLAGFIYAFSPYVFAHSLGHFNLTVIWPFPLIILLLIKIYEKPSWSLSFWLGLLISFLFYNDFHYFLFSLIIMLVFTVYYLIKKQFRKKNLKLWLQLVLVAGVVLVLIFPMLIRSLMVAEVYVPGALLSEVRYWSADLLAYFVPSFQNPFWGEIGEKYIGKYAFGGVESVVYIGWVVMALLLVSFWFKSKKRKLESTKNMFWWLLLVFFILSLGPVLKIAGVTEFSLSDLKFTVPLPYLFLYKLPYLSVARVPARFYVIISLSAAVLSAYSFSMIEENINRIGNGFSKIVSGFFVVFLMLLMFIDYSAWPMSMQDVSIPQIYNEIKADEENFTLLELPLWWISGHRDQGKVVTKLQYYQTFHEKRLLNGSVSRVPDALFDYYKNIPGIKYLIDVENNNLDSDDLDRSKVLKTLSDDLDIKYAILHKDYYDQNEYYLIREYFENILDLEIWLESENEIVYVLK